MRLASGARALHIVIEAFIEAYACISYRHRPCDAVLSIQLKVVLTCVVKAVFLVVSHIQLVFDEGAICRGRDGAPHHFDARPAFAHYERGLHSTR